MAYDNTIQAGRSALVRYEFRIPADAKGPLTITARVNYRHLRQSYLNNVLGPDHPAYPVVELAATHPDFESRRQSATPPLPGDNPDWMRWNNLGIAYLDQLQYADALHAFEQVVKLRPDYADGYINVGVTYIEWEKYSEARAPLEKALALSPDNARALYYLALGGTAGAEFARRRWPIWRRWSRSIPESAMRAASWASPITSSIATTKPCSSSRRCRRSIPTIWRRITISPCYIAAWA